LSFVARFVQADTNAANEVLTCGQISLGISVAKTAAEGGILRARGVVGGIFTYRDESRSRHFDLVGEGEHPWTIDLVTVTAAAILVVGFASALVAHLVR
jgi:hypothetical protein